MRITYEADDGQRFESKEDCIEHERLLPVMWSIINNIETFELGEHEVTSFLRDLKEELAPSCLERYLFEHRNEFARLAQLLSPITHER